jgi:alkylhydroperoxidase family enzyme
MADERTKGVSRLTGVFKASEYPGTPDEATQKDLKALFEYMFPGKPDAEFGDMFAAFAMMALNPRLTLIVAQFHDYVAREMPWSHRRDLRELTIQTINLHYKCDFCFQAHLDLAEAVGIGAHLQAAIPYWQTTTLFDDEQKLVIEYTFAVLTADVSDELFARVVKRFGEKGAAEFTVAITHWAMWAMVLNAFRPEVKFGRSAREKRRPA